MAKTYVYNNSIDIKSNPGDYSKIDKFFDNDDGDTNRKGGFKKSGFGGGKREEALRKVASAVREKVASVVREKEDSVAREKVASVVREKVALAEREKVASVAREKVALVIIIKVVSQKVVNQNVQEK
jgi:hypothetical protein